MTRLFRSTTALVAILSVITPTFAPAQSFGPEVRLAQSDDSGGDAAAILLKKKQAEAKKKQLEQAKKATEAAKKADSKKAYSEKAGGNAAAKKDSVAKDASKAKTDAAAKTKANAAKAKAADQAAANQKKASAPKAAAQKPKANAATNAEPKQAEAKKAAPKKPATEPKTAKDKAPETAKPRASEDDLAKALQAKEQAAVKKPAAPAQGDAAKPSGDLAKALEARQKADKADDAAKAVAKKKPAQDDAAKPSGDLAKALEARQKADKADDAAKAVAKKPVPPVEAEAAKPRPTSADLAKALQAREQAGTSDSTARKGAKPPRSAEDLGKALRERERDTAAQLASRKVDEDVGDAVRAASGKKAAPEAIATDAGKISAALAKARQAADEDEARRPKAVARALTSDSDLPDGESLAARKAAAGMPEIAEALQAASDAGKARSVRVTKDSARSSSEDFGTSVAAASALAAVLQRDDLRRDDDGQLYDRDGNPVEVVYDSDGDPIVVRRDSDEARRYNGRGDDRDRNDRDRDDDNALGTLAGIAAAGLTVYAVGQMMGDRGHVALNTGDRMVVQAADGSQQIYRDDDALLLRPGSDVATENFADGSSRSVVTRADGSQVVTIRDAQLRVLRRTLIDRYGNATQLIDDSVQTDPVVVTTLPQAPRPRAVQVTPAVSTTDLRDALQQQASVDRRFSLGQIRDISQVRNLVAPLSIDSITFDTGSAAIAPQQAEQLSTLGATISEMIAADPREMFLIEGYTDTVGDPAANLALSDRRAESLALALTEYFAVPPENMVVQGYGETFLQVASEGDVRENRRVAVRRITDLLQE